jgi:hypothetical protein
MHYRFEIQLIISEIVADATAKQQNSFARQVARQHVKSYLEQYYKLHEKLPTGRHYLGMTRPLNLEIGMVNFDRIRRRIQADSEQSNESQFA